MIEGHCHCSAVRFEITENPKHLVDCNCSICRRIGALWGHVPVTSVSIIREPGATIAYIQGDRTLSVHTCRTCGCTTHWENLTPDEEGAVMAVNFRMCSDNDTAKFEIRKFDGADTWAFLD